MASGAATLRDALLPAVDTIRGIPNALGMRLYGVSIVVRTWSGARPGLGVYTDAITPIKLNAGASPTTVRQVSQKEIVASGGHYQDQDLKIGPITPPYAGSLKDDDQILQFDPPVMKGVPTEILFLVTGPNMATSGSHFKKIGQDVSRPYHYSLILRKMGVTTPP